MYGTEGDQVTSQKKETVKVSNVQQFHALFFRYCRLNCFYFFHYFRLYRFDASRFKTLATFFYLLLFHFFHDTTSLLLIKKVKGI